MRCHHRTAAGVLSTFVLYDKIHFFGWHPIDGVTMKWDNHKWLNYCFYCLTPCEQYYQQCLATRNHLKPQEVKTCNWAGNDRAMWFDWFQKLPGLFHFLDARESPVSSVLPLRSWRFQHFWSGQHGDVGHMPLFPKTWLVEHVLCITCCHKQEFLPANPASVDGRRFKWRHHSFDLEWWFRRLHMLGCPLKCSLWLLCSN